MDKIEILDYMIAQYKSLVKQGYDPKRLTGYKDCIWDFAVQYECTNHFKANLTL